MSVKPVHDLLIGGDIEAEASFDACQEFAVIDGCQSYC